jgi:PLP dependent protein
VRRRPVLVAGAPRQAAPGDGRMALEAAGVERRLRQVRERIAKAGADPDAVKIVAVTKGHGSDAVQAALDSGLIDVGENYAGELIAKRTADHERGLARWHFLGHIQRNKVRSLAPIVHLWQSVDRVAAGAEIARRAPGATVLIQVNISGEPQKNGCEFGDVIALVETLSTLDLTVRGLMAVGPTGPAEAARAGYRRLASVARELQLPELSMGMSSDLEVAVSEGSTMVRIGEALFGPR